MWINHATWQKVLPLNNSIYKLLTSLLLIAVLPAQFGFLSNRSPQERFNRGLDQFNDSRYGSAAENFEKVLSADDISLHPVAQMMLMKAYHHAGNPGKARLAGRDFISAYPGNRYLSAVYLTFGDLFINDGQPIEAFRMYLQARRWASPTEISGVDGRLSRVLSLRMPLDDLASIKLVEGDALNRELISLAEIYSLSLGGQADEAADLLVEVHRENLPAIFHPLHQRIIQRIKRVSEPVVTVGVILPLTGRDATIGKLYLRGLRKAMTRLNRTNATLALMIYDNYSDPVETVLAVRQCAQNSNVLAILGPLTTTNSIMAATEAQALEIPLLLPLCTEDNLSDIGDYIFQANATLSMRGRLAGRYLAHELDLDSLAVLAPADEFGYTLTDAFVTEVDSWGKVVVATEWYSGIPENLRPQFQNLRQVGFDLREVNEYEDVLGIAIDSLDNMFDVSDEILFEIPDDDDESATRSDSAKMVLETIQGLFVPIHPGHIQYLGPQFPAYNLETQLIGNESWLDLEVLNQEIIGPHLSGMYFISGYRAPNDSLFTGVIPEDEIDAGYLHRGYDSGLLLSNLQGQNLTTRGEARRTLAAIGNYIGRGQITSFTGSDDNVNSSLQVLQYQGNNLINRGFFSGDSIVHPAPALP